MQPDILVTLTLAILITSIGAVEIRNLRTTAFAYLLHSIFLFLILISYAYLYNPSIYLWSITCFITKVFIIPFLIFRFIRRVPQYEYKPVIGFFISVLIVSSLLIIFYKLFQTYSYLLAPTVDAQKEPTRSLLAGALTIFCLGVYALLTRRDAIKTVIGVALMENGVHLVLLSLVPTLSETSMIGILTNVVFIVGILLYLSTSIYEVFGTVDTAKLSELKR